MTKKSKRAISSTLALTVLASLNGTNVLGAQSQLYKIIKDYNGNGYNIVLNEDGATLGYSDESRISILNDDGYAFKDLNRDGELNPYEDWRLDIETRCKDLSTRMTVEQIAGLMLYSAHQSIDSSEITDEQKDFITNDNLRHILVTTLKSPEDAAKWNNNVQQLSESLGLGIPANTSSDPRHGTNATAEYNEGAGGDISMWPSSLGIGATFDPEVMLEFGRIASKEYRALGIATALSPQVDLATDPRWSRTNGTTGESPQLSAAMAKAYVEGFQTSKGDKEIADGWGYESVNAMVKHWPGGGTGEAGRDAHYGYGKYAVYPGNNMSDHLIPFLNGAFSLTGGTKMASAVMPYYTISWEQNPNDEEFNNVGNSYSKWMITDLLREKYKFDGVVCTDWGITGDEVDMTSFGSSGKCWGVENLTEAERFLMLLEAGVDQFGGVNKSNGILDGYKLGVEKHGQQYMDNRMRESAVRLLRNIFRTGLFENPYLNIQRTKSIVGNAENMLAGYEAQLKSIVMLKNKNNVLPLKSDDDNKITVYIPQKYTPENITWWGDKTEAFWADAVNMELAEKYYNITNDPKKADAALVFVDSPQPGKGYDKADAEAGGNGYLPMTLQYGRYEATDARQTSIAGDSRPSDVLNRTYKDKVVTAANENDLKVILDTKEAMGNKPVVVCVDMVNPMVFNEFESKVDAILVGFEVQDQALFDTISGKNEPSGLLPMQMPANMKTVEQQYEDVPFDMECHVDSENNVYDFAFGMNWNGVIKDERTTKYAYKKAE